MPSEHRRAMRLVVGAPANEQGPFEHAATDFDGRFRVGCALAAALQGRITPHAAFRLRCAELYALRRVRTLQTASCIPLVLGTPLTSPPLPAAAPRGTSSVPLRWLVGGGARTSCL